MSGKKVLIVAVIIAFLTTLVGISLYMWNITAPIRIDGNNDFIEKARLYGWPGSGTKDDPYIISGYHINATGIATALYIGNTTLYFVVENSWFHFKADLYHTFYSAYSPGAGITLYNVTNGTLRNNVCVSNRMYGIYLYNSSNIVVENNQCYNNGNIYAEANRTYGGIYLIDSQHIWLENNTCDMNMNGIFLDHSDNNIIRNNNCTSNNEEGIYLRYSHNNTIEYNLCSSEGEDGIHFEHSTNNVARNNTCSHNRYGISLEYSDNNLLENNTCFDNLEGIYLYNSQDNEVRHSRSYKNVDDILLEFSNRNLVEDNYWYNGVYDGIKLVSSANNLIVHNLIWQNRGYGIHITGKSYHNMIYENSFYYNHYSGDIYSPFRIQACIDHYDLVRYNFWSYASRGNYWHDWSKNKDRNGDGIIDNPYEIQGGCGDDSPLKNPTFPMPSLVPSPPIVYLVEGAGYVNVTWTVLGNGSGAIREYRIYRDYVVIATVPGTQLWYNDTNVTNGVCYTYYVTAINSVGESYPSYEVYGGP